MIHKGKWILLQCFPKNSLAADVDRSKCLHATSPNAPFCAHYVDDVKYCSLITVNVMLELFTKKKKKKHRFGVILFVPERGSGDDGITVEFRMRVDEGTW